MTQSPSTTHYARGPPPHRFAAGRIVKSYAPGPS